MTNKDLLEIGFKEISHFTIGNSVTYDLGRQRILSGSGVGTFNEFLFIGEVDDNDKRKINECVCLHNYDYDGFLTIEKVKMLINLIEWKS